MKQKNNINEEYALKYHNCIMVAVEKATGETQPVQVKDLLLASQIGPCMKVKTVGGTYKSLPFSEYSFVKLLPDEGYYNVNSRCVFLERKAASSKSYKVSLCDELFLAKKETAPSVTLLSLAKAVLNLNYKAPDVAIKLVQHKKTDKIAISRDFAIAKTPAGLRLDYRKYPVGRIVDEKITLDEHIRPAILRKLKHTMQGTDYEWEC